MATRWRTARCNLACAVVAACVCTRPVVAVRLGVPLGAVVAAAGAVGGAVGAAGGVAAAGVGAGGGARPARGVDLMPMVRAGALERTALGACGDAPMLNAADSGLDPLLLGGGELGGAEGTADGGCMAGGGWVPGGGDVLVGAGVASACTPKSSCRSVRALSSGSVSWVYACHHSGHCTRRSASSSRRRWAKAGHSVSMWASVSAAVPQQGHKALACWAAADP